jgi:2'-5' RNA ligase
MTGEPAATRRLFFALWPDGVTRDALVHACRKAVRGSGGRPVSPENLHVTVAFLGSVTADRLADVRAAAAGLGVSAFELCFDHVGFWPRPQVLVALAATPPPEAAQLASRLWARLAPLGIPPDLRSFQPHVTLGRKVRKPAADLALRPVRWPVSDLALVESVTDPAGARYLVLERWSLGPLGPLAGPPGSPPEPPPAADSPSG